MEAALLVTWSRPIPGREKLSISHTAEVAAYFTEMAEQGKCSKPELLLSTQGSGIWFVKGDEADLREIAFSDQGRMIIEKGVWTLADFTYEFAMAGDAAADVLGRWAAAGTALGLL